MECHHIITWSVNLEHTSIALLTQPAAGLPVLLICRQKLLQGIRSLWTCRVVRLSASQYSSWFCLLRVDMLLERKAMHQPNLLLCAGKRGQVGLWHFACANATFDSYIKLRSCSHTKIYTLLTCCVLADTYKRESHLADMYKFTPWTKRKRARMTVNDTSGILPLTQSSLCAGLEALAAWALSPPTLPFLIFACALVFRSRCVFKAAGKKEKSCCTKKKTNPHRTDIHI